MRLTAIDQYNDLFCVEDVFPSNVVDAIIATDWLSLPWRRQEGQELWSRRRIDSDALPWMSTWDSFCAELWPQLACSLGIAIAGYQGTAWWLDEPGFTCSLHTDGEMPGALQMSWIGASPELGTSFYNFKDPNHLRYRFPMQTNAGYIMINRATEQGYRHLQWHGMLTPVPKNTFRLTSYSWITPL